MRSGSVLSGQWRNCRDNSLQELCRRDGNDGIFVNIYDSSCARVLARWIGEISNRDRERLEARLQSDGSLRESLEGLQRARAAVRSLPALRAPRNYYLTPEMVGRRREPRRFFPVFSFASAAATVLFVLLLVGDYILVSTPALAPLVAMDRTGQLRV